MLNPLATILVDVLLIGGALAVLWGMVAEAMAARRPRVGMRRGPGAWVRQHGPATRAARVSRTMVVGSRRAA